ncbi:MAG TPA: TonB-dependent receptor [Gammaproteobacteria bacterium]|nr:TonB-dependent receptor [Gammaproteobacteria bacterium]
MPGSVPHAQAREGVAALNRLSLEELGEVEVISVSKEPLPVRDAAAAVYVITRQDIQRSGATSLFEALRLAPNLLVTQLSAGDYALSVRGFGGNPGAQNFANKLLVLIDGRSVYSPLFSGVYADAQDVLLEDVERIEVNAGPGATLWGANAMNGVVNIVTRPAVATQGEYAALGAGNREQRGSVRHGGRIGESASYRVYGQAFARGETETPEGLGRGDDWYRGQGGFRLDWARGDDDLDLQGDVYRGKLSQGDTGWGTLAGANLLSRWQRATTTGALQLQVYFDQTTRDAPGNTSRFRLNTYDIEAQQTLDIGARHRVIWGAGYRLNDYAIGNSAALAFVPDERGLSIVNLFAQDTLSLGRGLHLTLGIKLEDHTYGDWTVQPDLRLAWRANDSTLLWTALSRAIRATTPFDRDVVERIGGQVILTGNRDFEPEAVTAWELGYRAVPWPNLNLETTLFVHDYEELRTVEPGDGVPLTWRNGLEGRSWGAQAWARWQVADWWRLTPGLTLLRQDLEFEDGAVRLLGTRQAGNDPSGHGSLTSSMDLGERVSFDTTLRHVARLRDPAFPSYTELGARLAWRSTSTLELSITGFNLLHDHHAEYPAPQGAEIGRSVLFEARWRLP